MAVQKAFDTLTDITKRRAYDSSLEFDDSIPGTNMGNEAWAFKRRSQRQPHQSKTIFAHTRQRCHEKYAEHVRRPLLCRLDTVCLKRIFLYHLWRIASSSMSLVSLRCR